MSISTAEYNFYLVQLIENWNMKTLINFLKEQNLKLNDDDLEILHNKKITSLFFLDMTKNDFKDLSEVLVKYSLDSNGIDSIPLFSPPTYEIQDKNKPDSLEAMCNEYIVALLHASIHIVMDITNKKLILKKYPSMKKILDIIVGLLMNRACVEDEPDRKRAKKAELEAKNSKLLKQVIEETTKYKAENDKLRVRIKKLEKNKTNTTKLMSENVEPKDQVIKVKQRQLQNDNSPNNGLSNFNSVAENYRKLLEDKEMDDFSSKEPVDILDSIIAQLEQYEPVCKINDVVSKATVSSKTSEKRGIDTFLNNVNKKSSSCISEKDDQMVLGISEEFKKMVSLANHQSHMISVEPNLEVSMKQDDELISEKLLDKNQIVEQGLIQELCGTFGTCSSIFTEDNVSSTDINFFCNGSENMILGSAILLNTCLIYLIVDTAIKSSQQKILDWYNYSFEFESKVDAPTAEVESKIKCKCIISAEINTSIPLIQVSNSSDNSSRNGLVAMSTLTVTQVGSSNRSQLSISILPDDSEEKQKYIIRLVLEQFPSLYLSDSSERGKRFNLNSSTFYPLCNGDHKEESLWNDIKDE
ncbi:hypothetical protein C1645_811618 [Glomus cerebriforme]|uniref:SAM domain-containing protein n=1 Tax=Glomus cerebriforme TaxID=658196 RepID=A0A397TN55_9GLOM|nr:hypothetical protein C1645_811618 [Glomus cerebriforme]